MNTAAASINQTQCLVRQVRYCPASVVCDRCQSEAGYYSTAGHTAIDLDLARPVLLQMTVSVHYCDRCRHYMRAQPPFMRPDSIYANEVVRKAVNCVFEDGMAMRRATVRLARDFWVQPPFVTGSGWPLTSLGWVGYLPVTENLALSLLPKTPIHNLLWMLEVAPV